MFQKMIILMSSMFFYANLGPNTVCNINGNDDYETHVPYNEHSFVLTETNCDEVMKVCYSLQGKTACGVDGISTKLLQCVIDVLVLPLTYIINLSFASGVFPEKLKIAKVVPVYKGGDSSNLINFRPVSVLPSISKIFKKLTDDIVYYKIFSVSRTAIWFSFRAVHAGCCCQFG